jgi:hypothetical protein
MKKLILFIMLAAFLSFPLSVIADQQPTESDMQILLAKIKADKKLLVAANMDLTEAEATKFWPVYDQYQAELGKLNGRIATVIDQYGMALKDKSMTDKKARWMIDEMVSIDQDEAAMKKSFVPKLYQALPVIKAARYLQIEGKIRAAIRYELASAVPLMK